MAMKALPFCLGLLCLSVAAYGRETAYKALRAFGTERGQALLSRVVEVQGKGGIPQPANWKIVLDDPSARGGVREVEVENSKIVAEHTPVQAYGGKGAIMDFQKLSLDSEGAFKIANMEAKNAQFGFDSIDYTLRVGDNTNLPVWVLNFLDENQKSIGSILIAADTGNVIARNFGPNKASSAPAPGGAWVPDSPGDEVYTGTGAAQTQTADEDEKPVYDEQGHRVHIGHEIKKGILSAGAALEEFFTGKRTLDRRYREPEKEQPYRGDD